MLDSIVTQYWKQKNSDVIPSVPNFIIELMPTGIDHCYGDSAKGTDSASRETVHRAGYRGG